MADVQIARDFVLFEFECGHVGRENEAPRTKTRAFIRMAELRMMPVSKVSKPGPDCKRV